MIFVALAIQFIASLLGVFLTRGTIKEVESGKGLVKKALFITLLSATVYVLWESQNLFGVGLIVLAFLIPIKKRGSVLMSGLTALSFTLSVQTGVITAILVSMAKIFESTLESGEVLPDLKNALLGVISNQLVYVNATIILFMLFSFIPESNLVGYVLSGLLLRSLL